MEKSEFKEWAILELMGHRKLGGLVSEETRFGTTLLRIDVFPGAAEKPVATQYYTASSLYALTPCSEEVARRFAAGVQPAPVARWELPALLSAPTNTEKTSESVDW